MPNFSIVLRGIKRSSIAMVQTVIKNIRFHLRGVKRAKIYSFLFFVIITVNIYCNIQIDNTIFIWGHALKGGRNSK